MTARRLLLIVLGVGALWGPLKGFAQQKERLPVVGVLALGIESRIAQLREGLRSLGYAEGRNIRLEERTTGDRYAGLVDSANEFVRLNVDVIVAMGSTATAVASKATLKIPIVMVTGADPVKEKLTVSLSHPSGNVTGVSTIIQEIVAKRLQLVKETMPGLNRVGILWDPDSRGSANALAQAKDAAKALRLRLQIVEARSSGDFDKAFETLTKSRTNAFVLMMGSMFEADRKYFLESAAKHRLAGVYSSLDWSESGGLFAYGPDPLEPYRHIAVYVDKILKGAKPGDLPIEQPTRIELVVNLRTAKALGIKIPQSILLRANRVIE
jgi:putative ABC transport system substrate-binding protein